MSVLPYPFPNMVIIYNKPPYPMGLVVAVHLPVVLDIEIIKFKTI